MKLLFFDWSECIGHWRCGEGLCTYAFFKGDAKCTFTSSLSQSDPERDLVCSGGGKKKQKEKERLDQKI